MKGSAISVFARIFRSFSNLTQEELARLVNVGRPAISRIESGEQNGELLVNIIDVCGGLKMLDWAIENLTPLRDWYIANKRFRQLLYI